MHIDTKLTKQHLSTKVYKTYFEYLKKHHPNINISNICEKSGLPYSYLKENNNWVSVIFDKQFSEECIAATNTDNLCFKVGQIGITKQSSGISIFYLLKYLRTIQQIHFDAAKYTSFFNKIMSIKIIGSGKNYCILKVTPIIDELNNIEQEALLLNFNNIIDNLVGFYSVIPKIKSLPSSDIEIKKEIKKNIPHYYLNIKYSSGFFIPKYIIFFSIPFFAFIFYLYKIIGKLYSQSYALIFIVFTISWGIIIFLLKKYIHSKIALNDNEINLKKLDDQYREANKNKLSLERKLKEGHVINKITTHLIKSSNTKDLLRNTCRELVKVLKYDRAIILIEDEKEENLIYHSSYGIDPLLKKTLSKIRLKIDIKNNDPNKISNVHRNKKPILITNVKSHLKTLEDFESKNILHLSHSKSFMCSPINTEKRSYGIILADYVETNNILDQEDLRLLSIIGNQAAIFLEKNRAQQEALHAFQESNELKDKFLANTTHELKTPLHGIIGLAESLIDGDFGPFNDSALENLQLISTSGKRLSLLVNDILDHSKMNNQTLKLNLKALNLYNVLMKVIIALTIPKEINIINNIPENLFFVHADDHRLQQIFFNLIGNSLKFTNNGEITIDALFSGNNEIKIMVNDTGVGIPQDSLDKICHTFFQVDHEEITSKGGTGLGLSITKKFVELHGGNLSIKSKLGHGTSVSFTLKKSDKFIPAENFFSNNKLPHSNNYKLSPIITTNSNTIISLKKKETVMIVDDEIINIKVLENFLKNKNLNIIKAENGRIALDLIDSAQKPDIILLDIMMPVMDGLETCKEIRKKYSESELPIIFLTAKREPEDLLKGFECGANDYLTKPFSKVELLARLKSQLSSSRLANAYSKFVPWSVLNILNYKSILDVTLGDGINQEMTILFIDIRNFTTFCEGLTPQEVLKFINSYLARMSPIIHKNQGIIDKFIGDCIMVTFKVAQDAVNAGQELLHVLTQYNFERISWDWPVIEVGIGVHTGPVIIGPIGYEKQLDITVMADSVNIAARIESLTKPLDSTFIVGFSTLEKIQVPKDLLMRKLGPISMRGKKENISIVELFPKKVQSEKIVNNIKVKSFIDEQNKILLKKKNTIEILELVIVEYLAKNYSRSLEILKNIDEASQDDKAIQYYTDLCQRKIS